MLKIVTTLMTVLVFNVAFADAESEFQARYRQTQAAAEAAFASSSVLPLTQAAESIHDIGSAIDTSISADSEHMIDCSVNPKPYGQANTSMCGFQAVKSYGWYADPVLVIKLRGYVSASKAVSGELSASDIQVAEISIVKPDPSGLE